jgi:CBS domain-containing protein
MLVRDVMSRDVEVIHRDKTVMEAAKMMKAGNYGSIPVQFEDKLRGMITDRDIVLRVVAEGRDPSKVTVAEIMTEGIDWCYEDETLEEVGEKMKRSRHRRFPVMSREKRLVGIISLGDLAQGEKDTDSITQDTYREIARH